MIWVSVQFILLPYMWQQALLKSMQSICQDEQNHSSFFQTHYSNPMEVYVAWEREKIMPCSEKQNKRWDWIDTLYNKISKNIRLQNWCWEEYYRKHVQVTLVILIYMKNIPMYTLSQHILMFIYYTWAHFFNNIC